MIIYTTIAFSFGLMFAFRYTQEIIRLVHEVAKVHDVDEQKFKLGMFAFWTTFFSVILMPAYLIVVLFTERQKLIKDWSRQILIKHYGLELKNSC